MEETAALPVPKLDFSGSRMKTPLNARQKSFRRRRSSRHPSEKTVFIGENLQETRQQEYGVAKEVWRRVSDESVHAMRQGVVWKDTTNPSNGKYSVRNDYVEKTSQRLPCREKPWDAYQPLELMHNPPPMNERRLRARALHAATRKSVKYQELMGSLSDRTFGEGRVLPLGPSHHAPRSKVFLESDLDSLVFPPKGKSKKNSEAYALTICLDAVNRDLDEFDEELRNSTRLVALPHVSSKDSGPATARPSTKQNS